MDPKTNPILSSLYPLQISFCVHYELWKLVIVLPMRNFPIMSRPRRSDVSGLSYQPHYSDAVPGTHGRIQTRIPEEEYELSPQSVGISNAGYDGAEDPPEPTQSAGSPTPLLAEEEDTDISTPDTNSYSGVPSTTIASLPSFIPKITHQIDTLLDQAKLRGFNMILSPDFLDFSVPRLQAWEEL